MIEEDKHHFGGLDIGMYVKFEHCGWRYSKIVSYGLEKGRPFLRVDVIDGEQWTLWDPTVSQVIEEITEEEYLKARNLWLKIPEPVKPQFTGKNRFRDAKRFIHWQIGQQNMLYRIKFYKKEEIV